MRRSAPLGAGRHEPATQPDAADPLRTGEPSDARRHSRAHHRQPRGGPPAAAHARRHRVARGALRVAVRRGKTRRLRRAGAAQRRVAEVRSLVVDEARRGQRRRRAAGRRAAPSARELEASTRCARSRTSRLLHPARILDRAARLGAREDLHDCVDLRQFRHCGQYAMVRRRSTAAARRPSRRPRSLATHERAQPERTEQVAVVSGGVATPRGFRAAGIARASRRRDARTPHGQPAGPLDLALIVSDAPASGAAVFTTNKAQAAPVLVSREHLAASRRRRARHRRQQRLRQRLHGRRRDGRRASHGRRDRARSWAARPIRCSSRRRASSASRCPWTRSGAGLPRGVRGARQRQGPAAARAIMTTDPFPKEAAATIVIDGRERSRSAASPRAPA